MRKGIGSVQIWAQKRKIGRRKSKIGGGKPEMGNRKAKDLRKRGELECKGYALPHGSLLCGRLRHGFLCIFATLVENFVIQLRIRHEHCALQFQHDENLSSHVGV